MQITESTKICSAHFLPGQVKKTLAGLRTLIKGASPSIFPWNEPQKSRKAPKRRRTSEHQESAKQRKIEHVPVETIPDNQHIPDHDYCTTKSTEDPLEATIKYVDQLKAENSQLKCYRFGISRFTTDPSMMKFFTGFASYDLFYSMYLALQPTNQRLVSWSQIQRIRSGTSQNTRDVLKQNTLPDIDQFFLFMCRCRLGLFEQDLACRFSVSVSTVSRIINTWANYLYFVLGAIPIWSPRKQIDENMPECFKTIYPRTRVILDCTEIKCQTPSSLYLNSQLYSHYKSSTTFKGLVGITPFGAVSFISQLYSGSISDVEITASSGIIDLLELNDDVMADKGFTIGKLVQSKGATLNIPPFLTNKRPQFEAKEVMDTQSIARVRIHVERAIRRIKEYHIFDSVIPLSQAGSINQIWTVCCLLTNLCGPLF